jgi:membrane protein implicated in regulation of membrane protease activity
MMLAPDKVMHVKGGMLVAIGTILILLIGRHVGAGFAVAIASIVMAWSVERYQAIRRQGTPDVDDIIAGSFPGVMLGELIEIASRLT